MPCLVVIGPAALEKKILKFRYNLPLEKVVALHLKLCAKFG